MQLTRESYKRIFFFTAGVIFILAVVPSDGVELSFKYEDKIKHIFAFFTLSFLLNRASSTIEHRVRNMVALLLFGAVLSWFNHFYPIERHLWAIYMQI